MRVFLTAVFATCVLMVGPGSALGKSAPRGFVKNKPVRVVVGGGSISMYFKGNYGQFLAHGCKNIEVVNRAKVGAGGRALVKRLRNAVLGDRKLMKQLAAKESWLLFQGGLNSVFSPETTNHYLAQMFKLASDSGIRTIALSLTPWGRNGTARFDGFEGVRFVRATKRVNAFLAGQLTPDRALGRRAKKHAHEWLKGERPEIYVDVFNSALRDKGAKLRDAKPLQRGFARSRYRRQKANKAKLVREAQQVPRNYMKKRFQSFDHIHPRSEGHRLMAELVCAKAPKSWGCDCAKIKRSKWHKSKVVGK
jgi:hypothetical protein